MAALLSNQRLKNICRLLLPPRLAIQVLNRAGHAHFMYFQNWHARASPIPEKKQLMCHKFISGWWFESMWKILVNWDDYSQYMGKYNLCSKPPTRYKFMNCSSIFSDFYHSLMSLSNPRLQVSRAPCPWRKRVNWSAKSPWHFCCSAPGCPGCIGSLFFTMGILLVGGPGEKPLWKMMEFVNWDDDINPLY